MSKYALDNNLAYVICCTYNSPYDINQGSTSIGLIQYNNINNDGYFHQNIGFSSYKDKYHEVI